MIDGNDWKSDPWTLHLFITTVPRKSLQSFHNLLSNQKINIYQERTMMKGNIGQLQGKWQTTQKKRFPFYYLPKRKWTHHLPKKKSLSSKISIHCLPMKERITIQMKIILLYDLKMDYHLWYARCIPCFKYISTFVHSRPLPWLLLPLSYTGFRKRLEKQGYPEKIMRIKRVSFRNLPILQSHS